MATAHDHTNNLAIKIMVWESEWFNTCHAGQGKVLRSRFFSQHMVLNYSIKTEKTVNTRNISKLNRKQVSWPVLVS